MPSTTSQSQQQVLPSKSVPPAAMPLISPPVLLQAHLSQDPPTRPSNRHPSQARPIDLNVGSLTHCHGSSVVKIGNTTIICGVRGEILPVSTIPSHDPKLDIQEEERNNTNNLTSPESPTALSLYNLLVPNLDLSTGCSPLHAPNTPPSALAQSLTQRLYTLLHTTHLIPLSDLQIKYTPPPDIDLNLDPDDPAYIDVGPEVKAYWTLYIDMVCISYGGEGATFDAAWLAMFAALRDTRLPRAWWDADEKVVLCSAEMSEAQQLNLRCMPVPLSFGVFSEGNAAVIASGEKRTRRKWVLVDMDAFEEESCPERGTVVLDAERDGVILRIEKSGGGVVDAAMIRDVVTVARGRGKEWSRILGQTLGA